MNNRNRLLLAFLIVQIVLIAYFYRSRPEAVATVVSFFPGAGAEKVQRLTIADGEGKNVILVKKDGGWVLHGVPTPEEPFYPADAGKVQALTAKLVNLQSSRLVTRTASSHNRLKVGTVFERRIELEFEDGAKKILYLGSAPTYNTIHVRQDKADTVYLANDLSTWETAVESSSWWQNQYLALTPAELTALELLNGHGRFRLEKGAGDKWQLPGVAENDSRSVAIADFVAKAARLTISGYSGSTDDAGLEKAPVLLTLETSGQGKIELRVGAKSEKTSEFPVKSSASPFYGSTADFNVQHLFDAKKEDFLTKTGQ